MSVRQVSIDTTTTDIKSYVCGFEDAVSTYLTDCGHTVWIPRIGYGSME